MLCLLQGPNPALHVTIILIWLFPPSAIFRLFLLTCLGFPNYWRGKRGASLLDDLYISEYKWGMITFFYFYIPSWIGEATEPYMYIFFKKSTGFLSQFAFFHDCCILLLREWAGERLRVRRCVVWANVGEENAWKYDSSDKLFPK